MRDTRLRDGIWRHPAWPAALFCVGLAIFVLGTVANLVTQAGSIDPYVYTGYVEDYHGLLARFGRTYYSTRIAFIHPARAFNAVLGHDAGYFTLRVVALACVLASIWSVAARFYGNAVAAFVTLLFSLHPWLLRAFTHDYVNGFALSYLLIALWLLIATGERRRGFAHVGAGACLALAANCYPTTIAFAGVFLPAWLLLAGADRCWRWRMTMAALIAAGFLGASVLLSIVLYLEYPAGSPFYDATTWSTADMLLRGEMRRWFRPLAVVLAEERYFTFVPVVTGLALGGLIAGRAGFLAQPRLCAAALVYLTAVIALMLAMHFLLGAGAITNDATLAYLIPATFLATLCLIGEAARAAGSRRAAWALGIAGAVLLAGWWGHPALQPVYDRLSPTVLVIAAAVAVAAGAARRLPAAGFAALLATAIMSLAVFYRAPMVELRANLVLEAAANPYRTIHRRDMTAMEGATYRGALWLMREIRRLPRPDASVMFWYPNADEDAREHDLLHLRSIQATYLYRYSQLGEFDARAGAAPRVDAAMRARALASARVVVLAHDPAQSARMRQALAESGVATRPIHVARFADSGLAFVVDVLERVAREAPLGPVVTTLPLDTLEATNGGRSLLDAGGLALVLPPMQWAYGLQGVIPLPPDAAGRAVLRVRLRVHDGRLGIGVLPAGDAPGFIVERAIAAADPDDVIDLDIPDLRAARRIVFRSWSADGIVTRAQISSIAVLRPE